MKETSRSNNRPSIVALSVLYMTSWDSLKNRFIVSLVTDYDIVKRITWEQLIAQLPMYKLRMLLGLQSYFKSYERISGYEHQYSPQGVPVFENSLGVRMQMHAWDYLMHIMPG